MNPVDILPFLTGAGGALFALVLAVIGLVRGIVVPRAQYNAALAEADKLREANETLRHTLQLSQEQNTQLANSTQVTVELMSVLRQIAQERSKS